MTARQRLELRMSENRQKANELLSKGTLTDEERGQLAECTKVLQESEVELRAAIAAEPEVKIEKADDSEARELRALTDRSDIGNIFTAAVEHRQTDGAESELQTHFKMGANQIPLVMLSAMAALEQRAVTPSPTNVQGNQAEITPGVFPQSVAAFLGIDMPTVGVGDAVFPVLGTNATANVPAENGASAETTGSFTADLLAPGRLQASFFYSRESAARLAGMDAALRMNLSDALADGLDKQVIAGTNGLLTGTILANNNVAAITTYANYRANLGYGRVDGKYAGGIGDIRLVMGSGTYGHAAAQFRSDNAGDRAALEDLMAVTGGVRVSAHVPAVSNAHKQDSVIRLGSRRDYVAPIWDGVTLIPDEVTLAGKGQIKITAVMLYATKLLRAGGFYKQQTQHA